jgi:hypothetical protein
MTFVCPKSVGSGQWAVGGLRGLKYQVSSLRFQVSSLRFQGLPCKAWLTWHNVNNETLPTVFDIRHET